MMGQSKEVDEWLLGSGESAETAASNQTKNIQTIGSGLMGNPEPLKKESIP